MRTAQLMTYLTMLYDKYKYILLLCIVGLALLLWPESAQTESNTAHMPERSETDTLEERICRILEETEGVGRAQVVLTEEYGLETEYAYDRTESENRTEAGYSASRQRELVTVNVGGTQNPVTISTSAPQYRGAAVVCEGGGRADVRLIVTKIVQSLTGISSDRIVISKMK